MVWRQPCHYTRVGWVVSPNLFGSTSDDKFLGFAWRHISKWGGNWGQLWHSRRFRCALYMLILCFVVNVCNLEPFAHSRVVNRQYNFTLSPTQLWIPYEKCSLQWRGSRYWSNTKYLPPLDYLNYNLKDSPIKTDHVKIYAAKLGKKTNCTSANLFTHYS
jgi:hypothetical protein